MSLHYQEISAKLAKCDTNSVADSQVVLAYPSSVKFIVSMNLEFELKIIFLAVQEIVTKNACQKSK